MNQDTVQARYDQLVALASRFKGQAEQCTQMRRSIQHAAQQLESDGWKGKGAEAFFAEMQRDIMPALGRLHGAMIAGDEVVRQIIEIMRTAEQEAARPFHSGAGANGAAAIAAAAAGGALAAGAATGSTQAAPSGPTSSGPYTIGPPKRPDSIRHDNGFLDRYSPESPTLQDYVQLAEWRALLEASKLATKAGVKDLDDANDAYEHFLDGKGADRTINLEEYYAEDSSGRQNLEVAVRDAQLAAEAMGQTPGSFQMTSSRGFAVGASDKFHPDFGRFDYPDTENWQKTIGAHQFWTSGDVQVTANPDGTRHYRMELTVHMEDRYNFNPGAADIASGVPDAANGRFEVTGLGKQYTNHGQASRVVEWDEGTIPAVGSQDGDTDNRGDRIGPNTRDRPRPRPDGVRGDEDRTRPPVGKGIDKLRGP